MALSVVRSVTSCHARVTRGGLVVVRGLRDETAEERAKDNFEDTHIDLICATYDGGPKYGDLRAYI